ncbi:hypothetical protein CIW52_32525 [Mycolicibacterium sp. P9-64]|uniref:hypothetical protein n=1 Tax=Mycolicibacterium sp. P9-64 TaxID=2024612 RepID=UPI0011ED0B56|nr:hypothetical protein [Mycolicibacterium sp. P9-64]KAA0075755.1 hypothetical protein CIW52_32525 [Mycolicibacterium sp. P9-64]
MSTVLFGYLLGWAITTIGLAVTVGKLNDRIAPAPHPIPLAVAAGVAWPLVLLGAAQFATVAMIINAVRQRTGVPTPETTAEWKRPGKVIGCPFAGLAST